MKKVFFTLLVAIGGLGLAHAADVTKRIFVITDVNFQTYQGSGLAIHAWYTDNSGDLFSKGNENEKMATFDGFNPSNNNGVWFKDITFDDSKSVRFFVYKYDDHGWHSSDASQQEVTATSNSYYTWSSQNNGDLSVKGSVKYYAYLFDGASTWTTQEMTEETDASYTVTIDNQTSYNSNLQVVIASSIALDNEAEIGNYKWNTMFRPYAENQTPGFSYQTNCGGGCWNNNSNSLKLKAPAHFSLTFKPIDWKYSLNPYIEKTIGAHEYSSFSSDYAFATPEGVTAYYASAASSKSVTLSPVTNGVPACQGVILNGTANETVKLTPATTTDDLSNNKLVAVKNGAAIPVSTEGSFTYVFAYQNDDLGFFKLTSSVNATADMAYLQTSEDISGAKVVFGFDEDATGIESIENAKSDNAIYNLNGVRVDNPTKGIFIQNGKKVIIK